MRYLGENETCRLSVTLRASGFPQRIHDGQQFCDGLLAFGGIGRARAKGFECTVDRLVDGVPVGRGARFQTGFRVVPLGLEFLDAGLGAGQIALVDQRGNVDDDGAERRQVAKLRRHGRLGERHERDVPACMQI
jgi:hypothetical protein